MKILAYLLCLLPLAAACQKKNDVTPQALAEFASAADAKAYFYDRDAQHMRALVGRDSAFFARNFADSYYNCTPYGNLNNKAAEIQTLIHGPWVTMESIAPQFDVFTYAGDLASLTNTKRIKIRTPAGGPASTCGAPWSSKSSMGSGRACRARVRWCNPAVWVSSRLFLHGCRPGRHFFTSPFFRKS